MLEALSFTNPLGKARLEAPVGLRHFPLQIPLRKACLEAGAGLMNTSADQDTLG